MLYYAEPLFCEVQRWSVNFTQNLSIIPCFFQWLIYKKLLVSFVQQIFSAPWDGSGTNIKGKIQVFVIASCAAVTGALWHLSWQLLLFQATDKDTFRNDNNAIIYSIVGGNVGNLWRIGRTSGAIVASRPVSYAGTPGGLGM